MSTDGSGGGPKKTSKGKKSDTFQNSRKGKSASAKAEREQERRDQILSKWTVKLERPCFVRIKNAVTEKPALLSYCVQKAQSDECYTFADFVSEVRKRIQGDIVKARSQEKAKKRVPSRDQGGSVKLDMICSVVCNVLNEPKFDAQNLIEDIVKGGGLKPEKHDDGDEDYDLLSVPIPGNISQQRTMPTLDRDGAQGHDGTQASAGAAADPTAQQLLMA